MQRILCFGDSNTYGYPPGGGPRMDAQTRWPCLLGAKLHCQVLEEGVCGRVAFYHDAGPQEQTLREVISLARLLPSALRANRCSFSRRRVFSE